MRIGQAFLSSCVAAAMMLAGCAAPSQPGVGMQATATAQQAAPGTTYSVLQDWDDDHYDDDDYGYYGHRRGWYGHRYGWYGHRRGWYGHRRHWYGHRGRHHGRRHR